MLTELQTRKITHTFNLADLDRDGVLQRNDYEAYAVAMANAFGVPHDSSAYQALQQKSLTDWEMTRQLAARGDDSITLPEFLAFHESVINSPMLDSFVSGYVDSTLKMWTMVDPQGPADGANAYRFARFLQVFGISQAEAEAAFRHLDRNGNGFMDRAEMIQAQKEFFTSNDPNAAGNWLLGNF